MYAVYHAFVLYYFHAITVLVTETGQALVQD